MKQQQEHAECAEIAVGQWRRDGCTFTVLGEVDRPLVLCEVRYRGVNQPRPEKVLMPASRVRRAEIIDPNNDGPGWDEYLR